MSNNRNLSDAELDALFKNAGSSTDVPAFDESFWTEMEAMLPAKKRRGAIIWWASGAAIIAVIGVLLAVNYFGVQPEVTRAAKTPSANNNQPVAETEQLNTSEKVVNKQYSTPLTENNSTLTPTRNRDDQVQNQNSGNNGTTAGPGTGQPDVAANNSEPVVNSATDGATNAMLPKRNFVRTYPVALNDVETKRIQGNRLPLYTEFAVGYGQSYKRIEFSNNWATQFRLTVGLSKEVPGMLLSAGLAFRAEMPNNLSSVKTETGPSSTKSYVREYRGLYSVEFPLEAAGRFGRNALGLFFVPGIQLGYTGNSSYYENNSLMNREHESGSFEDAKTMTMECGLKYSYTISERLMFTGSCTFDMVRPFQSTYYQGNNTDYPVTFFVGLRRNF